MTNATPVSVLPSSPSTSSHHPYHHATARHIIPGTPPLPPLSSSSPRPDSPYLHSDNSYQPTWLDYAKQEYGGVYTQQEVDDAACVVRLIPFVLLYIVYWAIYNQMNTSFFNQGCQLDLAVGSFTMPVSALNLFDTLIIIILIPIFEHLVYPALKRRGVKLTMLRKIGVGFVFAILAMCVAAFVEMKRLKLAHSGGTASKSICFDEDGDEPVPLMTTLSVFVQIPQFVLIGTSEVLASVTALELFYDQAPTHMRSVCAALNLVTSALGNWFSALLIPLVNAGGSGRKWITPDANDGHLDWFFWLLAGLMTINTCVFVWVAMRYQYKSVGRKPMSNTRGSSSAAAAVALDDDTLYLNPHS